jgi:outer membrane protein OmpA-like peptidoglycan-associated protein
LNAPRQDLRFLPKIEPKNKQFVPLSLKKKPFTQNNSPKKFKKRTFDQKICQKSMRNLFMMLVLCLPTITLAQIINPKEAAKRKAEQRANNRIDQGIDKGLDKIEGLFKKKEKKPKKEKQDRQDGAEQNTQDSNNNNGGNNAQNSQNNAQHSQNASNSQTPSLQAYSKFDFISGEKVVMFDDFSTTDVGDFPANWNTNASGEVVNLEGQTSKFLKIEKRGIFLPESFNELPENFTVEFDMAVSENMSEIQSGLLVIFPLLSERKVTYDFFFNRKPQARIDIHPVGSGKGHISEIYVADKNTENSDEWAVKNIAKLDGIWKTGQVNKISFWRQKTRLRMYVNENKVWDIPRAFTETQKYSMLFGANIWDGQVFIANLKVAVGQPDTRSKLLTDGKLITRGITFDVGSDKIKPESYGVLKEIAQILTENPTVKIKIVGHTDSDGDANKNLELSKKRADAISKVLSKEFKIDASRMQTDGKGATEPSEPNTTPQGKANNRRVEFIKL